MRDELHETIISAVRQNPSCINRRIVGDRKLVDPESVGPDVHLPDPGTDVTTSKFNACLETGVRAHLAAG